VDRIAAQRCGVVPSLAEHRLDIADRWASDPHLGVVPRGAWPVHRGHRLALRIPEVARVVVPAVAQVDATHERDVEILTAGMADDHELLMVRTTGTHSHVEQALATGLGDLRSQVTVLQLGELEAVQVRAPDQAPHDHPASGGLAQDPGDFCTGTGEQLVRITAPIGEQHEIAGASRLEGLQQGREVGRPVDQRLHLVAERPRSAVGVAAVDQRGRVVTLPCGQEPIRH
jgi:hypothetical protein